MPNRQETTPPPTDKREFLERIAATFAANDINLADVDFFAPARRIRDALADAPFITNAPRIRYLFQVMLPSLFRDFRNTIHALNGGSYRGLDEDAFHKHFLILLDWFYLAARTLPFTVREEIGGIPWALVPQVSLLFVLIFLVDTILNLNYFS